MIQFTLNGQAVQTDVDPNTPLLWVVRDHFKLKGSKFGCGAGLCGACTMHVDGAAIKTCVTPIAAVASKSITRLRAWGRQRICIRCRRHGMSTQCPNVATANRVRLWPQRRSRRQPQSSSDEIDAAMAGNICRCGCYPRIKRAIQSVSENALAYNAMAQTEGRA